jgi:flagellar basal-body rod modification protein FlgD
VDVPTTALLTPSTPGSPLATTPVRAASGGSDAFGELRSEDFLRLLITQLTTQDPFEPTGNQELFEQISSIRNIELSTTLTDSLRTLTGRQRFASASSLVGLYVTGTPDESGAEAAGIVRSVRFDAIGQTILELANGSVLPLTQLNTIESPLQAAERLMGQTVHGLDRRNPSEPRTVEGIVTAARLDGAGEVLLDLDTGGDLRFRDVIFIQGEPDDAES